MTVLPRTTSNGGHCDNDKCYRAGVFCYEHGAAFCRCKVDRIPPEGDSYLGPSIFVLVFCLVVRVRYSLAIFMSRFSMYYPAQARIFFRFTHTPHMGISGSLLSLIAMAPNISQRNQGRCFLLTARALVPSHSKEPTRFCACGYVPTGFGSLFRCSGWKECTLSCLGSPKHPHM